jgi:hypothetical protein
MFLNDLVLIDLESMTGSKVNAIESQLPVPVANASLSVVGNKCFVFGGTDAKGACFNDIRSLDVSFYLTKNDISVGEGAASDYTFKILIIGDSCEFSLFVVVFYNKKTRYLILCGLYCIVAVGKSSLLTRFSENTFSAHEDPTVGIDFNSRMIRVDRSICKLEIWDTAGVATITY